MKKVIVIITLVFSSTVLFAQIENPVHWSYAAKKLPDNTYALYLRATIDEGWHIYAQKQSKDAIAIPTKINFEKIPGLTLIGKPAESGKKDTYTLKEVGITNYEYAGKVDFIQKVKLDPGIKEIKGIVIFQACTHTHCLSEDKVSFTIPIIQ